MPMAVITIPWNTGGGNIYLTTSATSGTQTVQVSSDANTLYVERSQDLTFTTSIGNVTAVLTVRQKPMGASFDDSFDLSFTVGEQEVNIDVVSMSDTVITYNDTAIGYNR